MHRDPSLIPLSHQHHHGLVLALQIRRGLEADPGPEETRALAGKVAALADAELLGHFEVEETILFPGIRPFLESGALADSLIAEHRVMEGLLRRIGVATDEERIPLLRRFGAVLHDHIRTEERRLFPEIQARVPDSRLEALGRDMNAAIQVACPLG